MTTQPTDEAARRKSLRRRHLLQRQTIIFGSLTVILVALALAALGVFLNILPAPFDPDFTNDNAQVDTGPVVPCPAEGALPVEWSGITTNVYNGTTRGGLAGATAEALRATGVVTAIEANYPHGSYDGTVLITTGVEGISSAYSIAPLFPAYEILFDGTKTDGVIDVVVGRQFEAMTPDASPLDPAAPIAAPEGCTPTNQLRTVATETPNASR
ncbi:LytR C-terminal domain-containing protein [Salana multivorans]